ncbi:MAG: DMT family transporter, partial [Pseudomonadota bacterium]
FTVATVLACVISLAAITAGTLWQKASAADLPLRASLLPQFIGAAAVVGAGAGLSEAGEITWSPVFIAALAWLTLVLSIGAITLLLILVRENEAWRTASLFYLVPPITAVMAWALFGETLTVVQLIGMMLVTGAILSLQTRRAETIAAPGGAKRSAA